MLHWMKRVVVLAALASLVLAGCAGGAALQERETLYQVSTISLLMAGNYDGVQKLDALKTHGDVGIGTFNALDGEMVMLDGVVYRVKDSGKVERPADGETTPFSAVTFFDADVSQELGGVQGLDALKAQLEQWITQKNVFYALRIDGHFDTVKVRSVPRQEKPYPLLTEVTKNQPVFTYQNVEGTLIGFWCPEYVGGINVAGFHLHFLSGDRTQGGHVLDVSLANGKAMLDATRSFEMHLVDAQGKAASEEEINQVEK